MFYSLFFVVPLGLLVLYSFYEVNPVDYAITPTFTTSNYSAAFSGSLYRGLILHTIMLGLIVGFVVLVIAYTFAYIAVFVFPERRELLLFLMLASIFGGYLVRIYAWRTILGDNGVINSALETLGLIGAPLRFLLFSRFAVVVTLVNFLLPFGVLPLFSALQNVPRDAVEAARDLGAGPMVALRTVVLPMTSTGVRIAFAFAFVLASGDYVTPTLVGGTGGLMIGNVIADQFGIAYNWPLGAALAITTMLGVLVIYWLFSRVISFTGR